LFIITKQSGANILKTINGINGQIPNLKKLIDGANLEVVMDRKAVIEATLNEAIVALVLASVLVIVVVVLFLGNKQAALIPCFAVVVSVIGSFAVMHLFGFTLNIMSLMALIIATGLVVDDAIVVLENIVRHIENGMKPFDAAILGAKEMSFTLLAINLSLVGMFISILFSGGIVKSLFKEFSMTLAIATTISFFVAVTLTPMMCANYLTQTHTSNNLFFKIVKSCNDFLLKIYQKSLTIILKFKFLVLLSFFAVLYFNVQLFISLPKTLVPQQDTGQLTGFARGDNGLSYNVVQPKMAQYRRTILQDPAVDKIAGFIGGSSGGNSMVIVKLKPIEERKISATNVINRIRPNLPNLPGTRFFLMQDSDMRFGGGGQSNSSDNSLTVKSDDLDKLKEYLPIIREALREVPEITDINEDNGGNSVIKLDINRELALRYGVSMSDISNALGNSFAQRQVATIYDDINQTPIILEVDKTYSQFVDNLNEINIIKGNKRVPLTAFTTWETVVEKGSISHQSQFAVESIGYSLADGVALSDGLEAVTKAVDRLTLPTVIQTEAGGTASTFKDTASGQPIMILMVVVLIYIILGVLYESYIHPLTILSTLPSAIIGALIALKVTGLEFSLIAMLGLYLLMGLVKKNAILMIDCALDLQKTQGLTPEEAIYQACLLRFRPILMTTVAAILGAIPLVLANTAGSEMRQPLGVSIIGGLIISQLLTIYSTPVIYLYFDKLANLFKARKKATIAVA
jgi:multidrug efflux pump